MPPPRGTPAAPAGGAERVPPHSTEAERGVLGSILMDSGRVLDICQASGLVPEAFYEPAHRTIYEAMLQLQGQLRAIDLLTLREALERAGQLEPVGGYAALEQLLESTPTSAHAEFYLDIVQQKWLLRQVLDACRLGADACFQPDYDAAQVLSAAEQHILAIGDRRQIALANWHDLVKQTMTDIEHILQNQGGPTGLLTGFRSLDGILGGLQPADMIVLAARPSMGKTALAMNIVENVATGYNVNTGYGDPNRTPRPVGVFSLEMSKEALVRRMVCSRSRINWQRITKGFLSPAEHAHLTTAANAMMKAPIYVDDTPALEAGELRARARRMHKRHGVELVVIDYLQMLHDSRGAKESRQNEIANVSGTIKAMAKELHIPVLVLAQLNRSSEERGAMPKLADLRESG